MDDGARVVLPPKFGIIHDPEGVDLPKCNVYLGPYEISRKQATLTKAAAAYFGHSYRGRVARVDVPKGPWNVVGSARVIFYERPGRYQGRYFHPFYKKAAFPKPLLLRKCGAFFKLDLPDGCVVNDRGFVFP